MSARRRLFLNLCVGAKTFAIKPILFSYEHASTTKFSLAVKVLQLFSVTPHCIFFCSDNAFEVIKFNEVDKNIRRISHMGKYDLIDGKPR